MLRLVKLTSLTAAIMIALPVALLVLLGLLTPNDCEGYDCAGPFLLVLFLGILAFVGIASAVIAWLVHLAQGRESRSSRPAADSESNPPAPRQS